MPVWLVYIVSSRPARATQWNPFKKSVKGYWFIKKTTPHLWPFWPTRALFGLLCLLFFFFSSFWCWPLTRRCNSTGGTQMLSLGNILNLFSYLLWDSVLWSGFGWLRNSMLLFWKLFLVVCFLTPCPVLSSFLLLFPSGVWHCLTCRALRLSCAPGLGLSPGLERSFVFS